MSGIVLGLASALLWGTADFLARFASRAVGAFRALFYVQLAGLVLLTLAVILLPTLAVSPRVVGLGLILGTINTLAVLALYRSFAVGVLAIVSPIAASGNTLAVVLGLLSGERPTALKLLGIVTTTVGVLLTATDFREVRRGLTYGQGVPQALAAAGGFGVVLWAVNLLVADAGALWTTWLLRAVAVATLLIVALTRRLTLAPPPGSTWVWILPVAVLDVGAFWSYNAGLTGAFVAVVAVLSSLFSAVTVLLAWLVLRERLAPNQWLGVVLILIGVVLVSIPGL